MEYTMLFDMIWKLKPIGEVCLFTLNLKWSILFWTKLISKRLLYLDIAHSCIVKVVYISLAYTVGCIYIGCYYLDRAGGGMQCLGVDIFFSCSFFSILSLYRHCFSFP